MRKLLVKVLILLGLILIGLVSTRASHAAPGDFLYLWGAPQHLSGALGVAVDEDDNVYVTMAESIQVFNSSGERIRKWGSYGSGEGQLSYPNGIAVDGSGKVYVADTGNSRVQVFDRDGRFLREWTDQELWYRAPDWIATDGNLVYVASFNSLTTVRVYDSEGHFLRQLGSIGDGPGQYRSVAGLATDIQGNVYVRDWAHNKVAVYDRNGKYLRTPIDIGMYIGIAVDKVGRIYVTRQADGGILPVVYSGQLIKTIYPDAVPDQQPDASHIWLPKALAADSRGTLYTLDWYNDGLRAFDAATGAELPQWWSYGTRAGQMSRPQGIAVDVRGNVYETDGHDINTQVRNNRVQIFSRYGNSITNLTGSFAQTSGIAIDDDGNVHVLDTFNPDSTVSGWRYPGSIVKVFDSSGNFLREWGDPGPNPDFFGIAIDKGGNFLISDRSNSLIRIYDKAGNFLRNLGSAGSGAVEFNSPAGIAVDPLGNIFVVDSGNSRIQQFDAAYSFIKQWGSPGRGDGQFTAPTGITTDRIGHVFVADTGRSRVQVFDSSGAFLKKWGAHGDDDGLFRTPEGLAVDSTGTTVYVADSGNNRIQVFQGYVPSFSIAGTVREGSATGPALAGVTVAIAGRTVTTTSTGNFSINGIAAGTYTLTISGTGYFTSTITGFEINTNSSGLEFYLTSVNNSLSGTVRQGSASGAVIPGATVAIAGKTATTTSTGAFSITDIPTGTYTVTISKAGYVTNTITGYEITSDSSGLEFYLAPLTYSLTGTVRQGSATGPILAGATVAIAGKTATTSSTGAFGITGIPAGTYTVTISKAGYVTRTIAGYEITSNSGGLEFYLTPVYSLSGTLRQGSATGVVLAGATVAIAGKRSTTTSTGAFSITGIPAGTYTLSVSKSGYVTKTVPGCVIYKNINGVVFYLSPGYNMSGTVRQGTATGPVLPGATVAIAGKRATTSSTGAFSIIGIPPGTYTLTISKSGYAAKTVTGYTVNSNKSAIAFFLSPAYTIGGTVRLGSATGPVLAEAKVAIAGKSAITTSTGAFTITGIPAGTYTVTISRTGYFTKTVTGYVLNSNKSGLVFYLSR